MFVAVISTYLIMEHIRCTLPCAADRVEPQAPEGKSLNHDFVSIQDYLYTNSPCNLGLNVAFFPVIFYIKIAICNPFFCLSNEQDSCMVYYIEE